MTIPTISKSSFIRGSKCPKSLWLHFNQPEERDEISNSQQHTFDTGHSVGALAQQRFAGGVDASRGEPWNVAEAVAYTQELIEQGHEVIYEGAFITPTNDPKSPEGDLLCYIDILVKEEDGWVAYEVKASMGVKDYHVLDVAFQYHVITGSGLPLKRISLVHLNNQYVRRGELNLEELFTIEPMTETVLAKQKEIVELLVPLQEMFLLGEIPTIEMGGHCYKPFNCDFMEFCRQELPILPGTSKAQSANRNQEALDEFNDELEYPLFFMDFETIFPAIPIHDESRPYQQIPFQWSVHVTSSEVARSEKRNKKTGINHYEFLGIPPGDPRREFIETLLERLGSYGSIIVWNKTFEMSRLREIARDFPEYASRIEPLFDRVVDLMVPFRKKHLYLPEFNGSYSLKAVLPALIPELSYKGLGIQEGGAASLSYEQLYHEEDPEVVEKIRRDLLEYCKLDTWAMVRIMEVLTPPWPSP